MALAEATDRESTPIAAPGTAHRPRPRRGRRAELRNAPPGAPRRAGAWPRRRRSLSARRTSMDRHVGRRARWPRRRPRSRPASPRGPADRRQAETGPLDELQRAAWTSCAPRSPSRHRGQRRPEATVRGRHAARAARHRPRARDLPRRAVGHRVHRAAGLAVCDPHLDVAKAALAAARPLLPSASDDAGLRSDALGSRGRAAASAAFATSSGSQPPASGPMYTVAHSASR